MNRSLTKGKRSNGKGRRRKQSSAFSRFIRDLERQHGCSPDYSSGKNFQLLVAWGVNGVRPQVMPRPRGPSMGATLTVKQAVNNFAVSTGVGLAASATQPAYVAVSGATPVPFQIGHTLSDLGQVSTYASLFDQYKIERVHLRFTPRDNSINVTTQGTGANAAVPEMAVVVDRDDSSTLSGLAAALEYDNVQVIPYGIMGLDVIYSPSITKSAFASGLFSGYTVEDGRDTWLDIANTTVPYYGIKGVITALNTSATYLYSWQIQCWYEISFKNIR